MKFNKIVAIAIVLALVIVTSKTKTSLAISTITVATSTNFQHDLFIENRTKILQASQSNFVNLRFDNNKSSLCKINQGSIFEDWVNLLGRLIIIGSFTSLGVMGNSVLIQRYVKLIFKEILPIFMIVFLLLSLLAIISASATIYVSCSAPFTTSSLSSKNSCIIK